MPSPILLPIFTYPNTLSMEQSNHCSIDTHWSIVVFNTSHNARDRPNPLFSVLAETETAPAYLQQKRNRDQN